MAARDFPASAAHPPLPSVALARSQRVSFSSAPDLLALPFTPLLCCVMLAIRRPIYTRLERGSQH